MAQPILVSVEGTPSPVDRTSVTRSIFFVDTETYEYGVVQRAGDPSEGSRVYEYDLNTQRAELPHDEVSLHFDIRTLFEHMNAQSFRDVVAHIISTRHTDKYVAWCAFEKLALAFRDLPRQMPELNGVWQVAFFNSCDAEPREGYFPRLWINLMRGQYGVDMVNERNLQLHHNMTHEEINFSYYLDKHPKQSYLHEYLATDACRDLVQVILDNVEWPIHQNGDISICAFEEADDAMDKIIEAIDKLPDYYDGNTQSFPFPPVHKSFVSLDNKVFLCYYYTYPK